MTAWLLAFCSIAAFVVFLFSLVQVKRRTLRSKAINQEVSSLEEAKASALASLQKINEQIQESETKGSLPQAEIDRLTEEAAEHQAEVDSLGKSVESLQKESEELAASADRYAVRTLASFILLILAGASLAFVLITWSMRRSWIFWVIGGILLLILLALVVVGIRWAWRKWRGKNPSGWKLPDWHFSLGGFTKWLVKAVLQIAVIAGIVWLGFWITGIVIADWRSGSLEGPPFDYKGHTVVLVRDKQQKDHSDDPARTVTVNLQSYGYHGPLTLNRCWDAFSATLTEGPENWYSVWRDGDVLPQGLHRKNGEYGDFVYTQGVRNLFFLEGHGPMVFAVIRFKPNCN